MLSIGGDTQPHIYLVDPGLVPLLSVPPDGSVWFETQLQETSGTQKAQAAPKEQIT